jgi:hypothetical protein
MGRTAVLVVNGVDATSGAYLFPALTEHDLVSAVLETPSDARTAAALRGRHRRRSEDHLAPRFGTDETDLAQSGWGIVLPAKDTAGLVSALRPLLDLRREQASILSDRLYRELTGELGYRPGESKDEFLSRHGAGPGPVRPEVLPYYLLLVGGPDEIPFEFQYQLGVQHAVGRLAFDELDQYAHYAHNVVVAERRARENRAVRFSVFAPRAEQDPATRLSSELLAVPLAESFAAAETGWAVSRLVGDDAHKEQLLAHLAAPNRPDLLLTASHGVGFPPGHPDQREAQGALLCQDWPGPDCGPVTAGQYLAGTDLASDGEIDLTGMLAVCFACFGAGTPRYDGFAAPGSGGVELASTPFVAALPQAMLGRENGALAVVGHIDRAWSYSFAWPGAGAQTEVFRSVLARVGAGAPLGAAMSYLTDRYAELATELALAIEQIRRGRRRRDEELAGMWTAYADARDFVVIGDPAVSLGPVGRDPAPGSEGAARDAGVKPVATSTSPTATEANAPETWAQPAPLAGDQRDVAVEVATYIAEDMARVAVDPWTGRITGARLALLSHMDLDGSARHVVADLAGAGRQRRAAQETVAEIHARLLEVSVAARLERASEQHPGGVT